MATSDAKRQRERGAQARALLPAESLRLEDGVEPPHPAASPDGGRGLRALAAAA